MTNEDARAAIGCTVDRGVATITLQRADRLNALDEATRLELLAVLRRAAADPQVGAIVITGAGRAFCAGQDLAAEHELDDAEDTVARTYAPIIAAITESPVPVVAAVNGIAVGAGMGIALACDVVIMAESATMLCGFGGIGLVPDSGVSWQLVRALGYHRAFDLLAANRRLGAGEAVATGLATMSAGDADCLEVAQHTARSLAGAARTGMRLTRELLRAAQRSSLSEVLELEARHQGTAARSPEHLERRAEFLGR